MNIGKLLRKYWWLIPLWVAPVIIIGVTCRNWEVLAGIGTWILAAGIVFAIWQIFEARKSTNAQIAVELFGELRSKESKDTLGLIYRLRPQDEQMLHTRGNICSTNLRNQINGLLDKFEMLGSLVNHDIVDKFLAIEAFGGVPALRTWYCIAEYIRKEECCYRGIFVPNYEAFVRLCLDQFKKAKIPVKFYKEDPGGETQVIELMPFFDKLKKDDPRYPRSLEKIKKDREEQWEKEIKKQRDS